MTLSEVVPVQKSINTDQAYGQMNPSLAQDVKLA